MAEFLTHYGGTILVCLVLLAVVAWAIRSMARKKKKSGCGGGCDCCPSRNICHPEDPVK